MEPIYKWTREYLINNREECFLKLNNKLTLEEKIELKSNLYFKESGLVMLNHFMVTDIKEPEFYCEKYEITQNDGTKRTESARYCDKFNILDGEICESPTNGLAERQVCIISESSTNNSWIKDYNMISTKSNKRKIEYNLEEKTYLLKTYDGAEIKLNELLEIFGFLYPTNIIQRDAMDEDDNGTVQIPAYTIHAVSFKELEHNNPIIIHEIDDSQNNHSLAEIRQDLMKLFTQVLFGDELCANYLICHLISRVYSRVNDEALGKFTLNLITRAISTEMMNEYIKKFYSLIELLMPNSIYFPLTIENINTSSFVPKKDYETNNLSSGVLQVPRGTHIMLDETKLEDGKLDQAGCLAVQDLSEMIRSQQLSYDFKFYKIPFKTDVPVLIISEGKSFLPSDFVLPIKPQDSDSINMINENIDAAIHYMKPKLNAYRRYLTKCRLQQYDINEEEIKMIESDFVKMRENSRDFQVENLHSLLVLSRLLGISRGFTRLDTDSWETAKRLEFERNSRIEKRNVNEP